jgi:hypothetical protein
MLVTKLQKNYMMGHNIVFIMQDDGKRAIGRPRICPVLRIHIRKLRKKGLTYRDISEITGLSLATCHRYGKK